MMQWIVNLYLLYKVRQIAELEVNSSVYIKDSAVMRYLIDRDRNHNKEQ